MSTRTRLESRVGLLSAALSLALVAAAARAADRPAPPDAPKTTGKQTFQHDTIKTSRGDLKITFIGHGTLMFTFNKMTLHVDPFSRTADYSKLPKADIVLVTHHHGDHLDPAAVEKIKTGKTK